MSGRIIKLTARIRGVKGGKNKLTFSYSNMLFTLIYLTLDISFYIMTQNSYFEVVFIWTKQHQ